MKGASASELAFRLSLALLLLTLAAAAAFNVWLAGSLIGRSDETRYGEAILYDHAARLLRGEALYQSLDGPPYTIATYTPLYYWLAAGLRGIFGPGFVVGRVVSALSGVLLAAMSGWLVWRRTRSFWAAALAGLLVVALGLGGITPWTAAYKEDLFGVALAVASVVVLEAVPGRRGVVSAGVLAALTVLTKQSLLGPAIFGTLWLLSCRRLSAAVLYAVTAGLLGVGVLGTLQLSGQAVWQNVVSGNLHQPFDSLTFAFNLRELVIYQAAPLVLALVTVVGHRQGHQDLLIMSWLGSLVPMLALGAIGADNNYWLQLAALTAVLAALTVWRLRGMWLGAVGVVLLVGNVAVATYGVASWVQARPTYLRSTSLQPLVERVAAARGTVLADPLDVLVLANRPILLEPIVYALREQDGSWDPSALVGRICGGEVSLVVLGYPLGEMGQRFPVAVAEAVQRGFVVEGTEAVGGGQRWLLVPRSAGVVC